MAPIPVHTTSPINTNTTTASHAIGTSPSTAAARYRPADAEPRPTNAEPSKTTAQPPQPGAPAIPQPTNTISSSHNYRHEPTPTATLSPTAARSMDSPPPPQPGAVPSVPTTPDTRPLPTYAGPPPPAPVIIPQSTSYDLSHPPGYRQNHHASFDDKPLEQCQPHEPRTPLSLSASRRGGILDDEPVFASAGNGSPNNDSSNVLNTALAWAKAAGQRLSKTEEQIWKSINANEETWVESGKNG